MDCLVERDMDIADSVCPAPMIKFTFAEYRRRFGDKIAIWDGIPSIVVLKEAITDSKFYTFMDDLFTKADSGKKLGLSIADKSPPKQNFPVYSISPK
jgi:hypothetical protein